MDIFHFKQFDVAQDRCAMKVGTDGVLLGALALSGVPASVLADPAQSSFRVLDIGTGTGLIALMVAQQLHDAACPGFHIDAIEVDPLAALQAHQNVSASPWHAYISVHAMSLQQFVVQGPQNLTTSQPQNLPQNLTTLQPYNLIISNPPFYNATLKPDDEARAVARHKDSLPLSQIMQCAQSLLLSDGELRLIYPTDYDAEVMTQAVLAGLHPVHIWDVLTKVGKPCKRRITAFCPTFGSVRTETLAIRDASGLYTDAYRLLTDAFYTSLR